ncbi:chaperone modulator CbpM [uncultured Oxalicibacterium sp.]|uniref:chaperone modulator CbpM n=1 Tax=uncultured Oxalicibacterium sp. TaxID=1168540 RepID=UPI0025D686C6|nr:chaperone modulator CbpM [uncultured Oxalicibacterium sp.]
MNQTVIRHVHAQLIDDDITLTLTELCHSCHATHDTVSSWVSEGVLVPSLGESSNEPDGSEPANWRFNGTMLRRARLARQMADDMEINAAGIALALDLLERIDSLHAQLARLGHRTG